MAKVYQVAKGTTLLVITKDGKRHHLAPKTKLSDEIVADLGEKKLLPLLNEGSIVEVQPFAPVDEDEPAEDEAPPLPPGARPRQPWSVDPAKLAGKTKEQLTVMAREADPKVAAFATADDGVKFLSQNFGK